MDENRNAAAKGDLQELETRIDGKLHDLEVPIEGKFDAEQRLADG